MRWPVALLFLEATPTYKGLRAQCVMPSVRLRAPYLLPHVEFWETKYDRYQGDSDCNWVGELAKAERSSYESIRVDDTQGDGNSYDPYMDVEAEKATELPILDRMKL